MSHEAKEPDHVRASKAKRALDQVGADRLLNDAESAALLAIGVSSLWRHTRSTLDFPQPVRFGRTVRWRRSDLERFIDARAEAAHANIVRSASPRGGA